MLKSSSWKIKLFGFGTRCELGIYWFITVGIGFPSTKNQAAWIESNPLLRKTLRIAQNALRTGQNIEITSSSCSILIRCSNLIPTWLSAHQIILNLHEWIKQSIVNTHQQKPTELWFYSGSLAYISGSFRFRHRSYFRDVETHPKRRRKSVCEKL